MTIVCMQLLVLAMVRVVMFNRAAIGVFLARRLVGSLFQLPILMVIQVDRLAVLLLIVNDLVRMVFIAMLQALTSKARLLLVLVLVEHNGGPIGCLYLLVLVVSDGSGLLVLQLTTGYDLCL